MRKKTFPLVFALAFSLSLLWCGSLLAADESAKVAGTWELSFQGRNGTINQTLKLQQDGNTLKGTLTGRRGEAPIEGSVDGNNLKFTVKRETPNGTFTVEYSGTVDGDAMKGKFHSERFDGEWTAKRGSAPSEK